MSRTVAMTGDKAEQAAEYVGQGTAALGRGEFRAAEVYFRQAMRLGADGPALLINLGQSLLAQARWWGGGINFYIAVKGFPEDTRNSVIEKVSSAVDKWAGHLSSRQLLDDSTDCKALMAALSPFPEGPVCFAARWIPAMTIQNGTEALTAFARWARISDSLSDPLREDDLLALLAYALKCAEPESAVLRLYEGLMMHLTHANAKPGSWYDPLAELLNSTRSHRLVKRCTGIVLEDLFSRDPHAGLQKAFRLALENSVQSKKTAYREGADVAYAGLQQRLHGEKLANDRAN